MKIIEKVICDICGEKIKEDESYNWEGQDLCFKDFKNIKLEELKEKRNKLNEWLKITFLEDLEKISKEILELEPKEII